VDLEGFTETYRRFYFRDLQAVTMRTTFRRAIWNGILGVLLLIPVLEAVVDGPNVASIFWMLLFGFFLAMNNVMGTACRVFFQTAVQTEEIPSLSRVRRTRKVLARIRPLIAESQGLMSAEEAAAGVQEAWREEPKLRV
jgi:hypothetical protein